MNTGLSDSKLRLRTLGSVDLTATDGTQVQSVLRQPKRLALLIYLALTEPVFHRRDRLLAIFWPESDEERARGSLSQTVFQLRSALGRSVIHSRGDGEVGLATDRVWCDAVEFDDRIRRGELAEAMALYTGELLPGFNITDAPDFERWLDEERARRAQDAARACGALADEQQAAGQLSAAIDWIRRAIAIQPFSEPAYQRLIALLDASGDRAAALQAYDELCELLRREFDAEPAAETVELIHAVRARADAKRPPLMLTASQPLLTAVKPRRRSAVLLLGSIGGFLAAGAVLWTTLSSSRPQPYRPPANRVAVLYFTDESATRELAYLAEGLTSTLIDQLGQIKKIQVISRNGVRPFRGSTVPLTGIARQLDVGTLVGGSVTRSGDKLRVTVELIDGASGIVMQSRKVERPNGELFALLDDLSGEVASFLRTTLGQEIRLREWRAETRNVQAWQLLQEAEFLRLSAEDSEDSGRLTDTRSALARADSLSVRALAMDRRFGAALVMRGRIAERRSWLAFMTGKSDSAQTWLAAAADYAEKAIELDERDAAAYELRGALKYWRWLWLLEPVDAILRAAEADLRRAIELSTERPRAESVLSMVLYSRGEFAESRSAALRALQTDAYLTDADQITIRLFQTSFELGEDAEAGQWCDEVRRRFTGHWPAAWCDLTLLAWSEDSNHDPRKAIHLLENFGPADAAPLRESMRPRLMMHVAAVLGRDGQRDSANAMIGRALQLAPQDVELLHLEAAARTLMQDEARAVELIGEYLRRNPSARPRILQGRIFGPLKDRLN